MGLVALKMNRETGPPTAGPARPLKTATSTEHVASENSQTRGRGGNGGLTRPGGDDRA